MSDKGSIDAFWADSKSQMDHSERYHLARMNFWKGVRAVAKGWNVVANGISVALALALPGEWLVASSVFGLLHTLGQFSCEGARKRMDLHDSLRKDFLRLKRKLESGRMLIGDAKANLVSSALSDKSQIELREPDHLRVLQTNCQNELWALTGCHEESDEYIKITCLQRRLMHFVDWRPHTLFNNKQRRDAKAARAEQRQAHRAVKRMPSGRVGRR